MLKTATKLAICIGVIGVAACTRAPMTSLADVAAPVAETADAAGQVIGVSGGLAEARYATEVRQTRATAAVQPDVGNCVAGGSVFQGGNAICPRSR